MSLRGTKWVWPEEREGDLISNILIDRFGSDLDIDGFLNPEFELADPFLLTDMKVAIKRIKKAIDSKEKIVIFGDYDVDGVTSTALLWELFRFIGIEVDVYIPERFNEGYGLKASSLKSIFDGGAKLLITVDCGIRDVKEIKKISEAGLDVIVTDHHEPGTKIPDCVAVINPKRSGNKYPCKELAGVGVAYALSRALLSELPLEKEKIDWWLKWNLDLVAIGTVADMVPLFGENRVLVKYGLKVLNKTKKIGLHKLMELAGKRIDQIGEGDIGFVVGPRLNAAGRLEHALAAYNLLTQRGELEVTKIAQILQNLNQERRSQTEKIVSEAMNDLKTQGEFCSIVMAREGWSRGVVGLVASRLVERFYRPAFIAEQTEERVIGSARGVRGISVVDLLEKTANYLEHYGGHEAAGGFSMKKENWSDFAKEIDRILTEKWQDCPLQKEMKIAARLDSQNFMIDLWESIKQLKPFGMGNPEPTFGSRAMELIEKRLIGQDKKHLKLLWKDEFNSVVESVWWQGAVYAEELLLGNNYDLAYKIDLNEYMGNRKVIMVLEDVEKV